LNINAASQTLSTCSGFNVPKIRRFDSDLKDFHLKFKEMEGIDKTIKDSGHLDSLNWYYAIQTANEVIVSKRRTSADCREAY